MNYTRKTKAQLIRELEIEAALNRVRVRALNIQESGEIDDVTFTLLDAVRGLGLEPLYCSINIYSDQSDTMELSFQVPGVERLSRTVVKKAELVADPAQAKLEEDLLAKYKGKAYSVYQSDQADTQKRFAYWMNFVRRENPDYVVPEAIYDVETMFRHHVYFKQGHISVTADHEFNEGDLMVLKRFADVFDFAYARFLELKAAEDLAREAQRRGAVDRVRAEATGMEKTEDIADVLKTLWEGLKGQDVSFDYVTLYVADEDADLLQVYAAVPESNPIKDLISDDVNADVRARQTFREDMIEGVDLLRSEIALSEALELGFSMDYFSASQVVHAPRSALLIQRLWGITLPENARDQYALRVGWGACA
ncbi:MAG: hypothetical protein ACI8V2_004003 [Candidatus Latescibacterota bacterium]|jgi:hypothetical protein